MMRADEIRAEITALRDGALAAVASIWFGGGRVSGVLGWLALAMAPRFAFCALTGVAAAWAFGRMTGFGRDRMRDGEWLRSAFLCALAAAWISVFWQWTAIKWPWLAGVAGIGGFLAAATAEYLCVRMFALPALSLGFAGVGFMLWTIHGNGQLGDPDVLHAAVRMNGPGWLDSLTGGFLKTLGAVLFLPHPLVGSVLLVAMLIRSRVAVLAALAGWGGGLAIDHALRFLAPWLPPVGVLGYNSLLVGLAIGACYFVPSWRGFLAAAVAGGMSMAVWHALAAAVSPGSALLVLPFSFLITTWGALAALRLRLQPAGLVPAAFPGMHPEEMLRLHHERLIRDPNAALPALRPPFDGERVVTQGVDGSETHRGLWKDALDFEILDGAGAAAPPGERRLEDYYTFHSPVLAPVSGWVVRVEDEVEDNLPGHHNLEQNWGNYVILRMEGGHHVMLAHFQRRGLLVVPGQYVPAGSMLGYCGNSGRSPVPHLHLHCQGAAEPGAATQPFRMVSWILREADGRMIWKASGIPPEGARMLSFQPDPWATRLFQSWRTGTSRYRITKPGGPATEVTLEIRFTDAGQWHFRVPEEHAECYGSVENGAFCLRGFRSRHRGMLFWMWLALARVPFTRDLSIVWQEQLPAPSRLPDWLGELGLLLPTPRLSTTSRLTGLHGSSDRLDAVTLLVEWVNGPAGKGSLEAEIALFAGLERLSLQLPQGQLTIKRMPV